MRHPAVAAERTAEQTNEIRQLGRVACAIGPHGSMILKPGRFTGGQPFPSVSRPLMFDSLGQGNDGGTAANADGGARE